MLTNRKTSNRQSEKSPRAQALVELALILPIMLILILGAVDFGRLFMTKLILTNAAREGANYISYNYDEENIGASLAETKPVVVAEGDSSGITIDPGLITFTGCCTPGEQVSVSVTNSVDLIFDTFLEAVGIIDGPVTLTSTVTMMVQ